MPTHNFLESPFFNLAFSPDSQHLAYVIKRTEKKWFVVLDNKEQEKYDSISDLSFSPESKSFMYNAQNGRDLWLVVTKTEEK
jgi:hypothetical protein